MHNADLVRCGTLYTGIPILTWLLLHQHQVIWRRCKAACDMSLPFNLANQNSAQDVYLQPGLNLNCRLRPSLRVWHQHRRWWKPRGLMWQLSMSAWQSTAASWHTSPGTTCAARTPLHIDMQQLHMQQSVPRMTRSHRLVEDRNKGHNSAVHYMCSEGSSLAWPSMVSDLKCSLLC